MNFAIGAFLMDILFLEKKFSTGSDRGLIGVHNGIQLEQASCHQRKENLMVATAFDVEPILELDITIVEAGDATEVVAGDTDNGCDTLKNGDC